MPSPALLHECTYRRGIEAKRGLLMVLYHLFMLQRGLTLPCDEISRAAMTMDVCHQQSTGRTRVTLQNSFNTQQGREYMQGIGGFDGLLLVNPLLAHMVMMGIFPQAKHVNPTMKEGPSTQPNAMKLRHMVWKGRLQSYMAFGLVEGPTFIITV
jgi:hypothetical protein